MVTRYAVDPSVWISIAIIFSVFTVAHFTILVSEIKSRSKPSSTFTSKWFRIFSIGCIVFQFLYSLFGALGYTPVFCMFGHFISPISGVLAAISMGLYQLHRLYYCFANSQIHSNKGYPTWVFIVMHLTAIQGCINWVLLSLFGNMND